MNRWHFFFTTIGVYIIFSVYFITNNIRAKNHNTNFLAFYGEFDQMTTLYANYDSSYFEIYKYFTIYTSNPTPFNDIMDGQLILDNFSKSTLDLRHFYQSTDNFISVNADVDDTYHDMINYLNSNNICNFITIYQVDVKLEEYCQNALNGIARYGLPNLISGIYNTMKNFQELMIYSNYSSEFATKIVSSNDFRDMDSLMIFGDLAMRQYIKGLKQNLYTVLDLDIYELYIFLICGLILIAIGFILGWIPFLKNMNNLILDVKQVYFNIQLEILISNPYMKKWLFENSDHSN